MRVREEDGEILGQSLRWAGNGFARHELLVRRRIVFALRVELTGLMEMIDERPRLDHFMMMVRRNRSGEISVRVV